jgi:hypothetical protein
LTQKKRIYDLAKEYGMSGDDLAKKLRDMGFSEIKGRMTALDDFMVLQIQGTLEAHGLIPESQKGTAEALGGGLVLKRKKKKKLGEVSDAEEGEATAPATPPAAAPEREEAEPVEPEPEPETVRAAPVAETPVAPPAPAPVAAAPVREPPAPVRAPAPAEPEPRAPAPAPVPTSHAAPAAPAEPPATVRPAPRAEPKPVAAQGAETAPAAAPKTGLPDSKLPKRQGKVVGFIDLSKIQSAQPKKPESRRIRSKDDVAPQVMPTLSHDKKRALLRGDRGAREQLTAGQLREREAAASCAGGRPDRAARPAAAGLSAADARWRAPPPRTRAARSRSTCRSR